MLFLMNVSDLQKRLERDQEDLVLVDVRFNLGDQDAGRKQYLDGHIPNAIYLDLNKDLSGKVQKHGGNHPLPDVEEFAAKLGNIGIDNQTTVVIYDQENDMFAARMWWLLYYIGHDNMYILDGGFKHWLEQGKVVTAEIPSLNKKTFISKVRSNEIVDINLVKGKVKANEATLIDSRAKDRYLGRVEPLYAKAGHIPGATNFFWKDVLTEGGSWKSTNKLDEHFQKLDKEDEIIVSCGSGVSACPNIIALKALGFQNVKLYPGSFSDWISYEENEIETKEE